jgi:hypothetical protein
VFLALGAVAQNCMDSQRRAPLVVEEMLYFSSGEALKRAGLGFDGLMADVYWIRTLLYFGGEFERRRGSNEVIGPECATKPRRHREITGRGSDLVRRKRLLELHPSRRKRIYAQKGSNHSKAMDASAHLRDSNGFIGDMVSGRSSAPLRPA